MRITRVEDAEAVHAAALATYRETTSDEASFVLFNWDFQA